MKHGCFVQVFREARRTSPSIIYMPHIGDWWDVIHSTLQATFLTMLQDIQPDLPILLIATSETRYQHLPIQACHTPISFKCIYLPGNDTPGMGFGVEWV